MGNLRELLNITLPSDKILNRKPKTADNVSSIKIGGDRKQQTNTITVPGVPQIGDSVMVKGKEGAVSYKVAKIIYDETGAAIKASVILPTGGGGRTVSLNITGG